MDVPETVAEHDVIRRLPELCDVALGVAQQPGGVAETPASLAGVFLDALTNLATQVDKLLSLEAGRVEGCFHPPCVESSQRSKQLRLVRLKPVRAAVLIYEHAPTRA